jgi:hypothetical protein
MKKKKTLVERFAEYDAYETVRASLNPPPAPGELTLYGWMEKFGLDEHSAQLEIQRALRSGKIVRVGARCENGKRVTAYKPAGK